MTLPKEPSTQTTQTKPEWTWPWETAQGLFWSVSYLAMVAFAYFTPLDVLDTYPQAKEFSDFMASWNMQIRRVGEISGPANQANRFVYSVLWCVMPLAWISMFLNFYSVKKKVNFVWEEKSWSKFFFMNALAICFLWLLYSLPYDARNTYVGTMIFIRQLPRAIFSPGFVWIVGLFFMVSPLYSAWAVLTNRVVITGAKNG